jgi:hypothetical protein
MRKQILSQAAWLTVLWGSAFSTSAAETESAPLSAARSSVADTLVPAAVPGSAHPSIITTGPVYAYGPVIPAVKPRQRPRAPNWSGRNINNFSNMRAAEPYGSGHPQRYGRPWQAPPRPTWNQYRNNPYSYDSNLTPWQEAQRRSQQNQWVRSQYDQYYRSQNPRALAWYERGGRQYATPDRNRQPDGRY